MAISLKMKDIYNERRYEGNMVWVAIIAIAANIVMYLVLPSSSTGLHTNVFVTINNFVTTLTGGLTG